MNLPNLIIAGAQKSGTTWLHSALKKHDQIFMSEKKELNFFNKLADYDNEEALQAYLQNFDFTGDHKYIGESTPAYMWVRPDCPPFDFNHHSKPRSRAEYIKRTVPDAKVILLLRNPVTRAVSAFHHHFALGRLTEASQIDAVDDKYKIHELGRYARHLKHWQAAFGENLFVYLYDDLKADGTRFLSTVFNDLDVDDESGKIGGLLASQKVNAKQKILARSSTHASKPFPHVSTEQISAMVTFFESDIAYVESFIKCDLAQWRDVDSINKSLSFG